MPLRPYFSLSPLFPTYSAPSISSTCLLKQEPTHIQQSPTRTEKSDSRFSLCQISASSKSRPPWFTCLERICPLFARLWPFSVDANLLCHCAGLIHSPGSSFVAIVLNFVFFFFLSVSLASFCRLFHAFILLFCMSSILSIRKFLTA